MENVIKGNFNNETNYRIIKINVAISRFINELFHITFQVITIYLNIFCVGL